MTASSEHWLGPDAPAERRLAAILSRLDGQRRAMEGAMRLGTADLRLLWLLADGRARTLREIADELRLEQSTINRQVNAALASGYVERRRRDGGSAHEFERTDEGRRVFDADTARSLGAYASALSHMGPQGSETFLGLAHEFLDHYQREVENAAG
ncbi:MarR family winged helix-turn-helix transcriptional regulator [Dietzia sp. NPDC055340]